MSGKYGTSNAGAEFVGVSGCNKVYKEAVLLKHYVYCGIRCVGLRYVGEDVGFGWIRLMDQVESVRDSKVLKEIFLEFKNVSHDFIPDERCVWIDLVGLPLASWAPESLYIVRPILNRWRSIASNLGKGRGCRGPSLDEVWNMWRIWMSIVVIQIPLRMLTLDSVSPSSRVLREEDVRGVESDLVDSFEEGEIRDDSDVRQLLLPEKDSIIAHPFLHPGNDLNIAVESGSSWIDYIGPLTSDEIDSDKRWSYRDPNENIHGLFSLAQLRSWKDYFSSDLQIWSYYGNVKEAILLHNALSRQTNDAG
ncbi:zinc finger CCCH domain-containing protein 19 [Tanacetum coccineum]|uniref:Zinc finger CCCH domain-containing protein 19 n=1 Tax=Tanacetum coccineum TaxID=301880 RepID=A0ABQ5FR05_9ASTR